MKGPQDIRREKEYNLVPDKIRADDFDRDTKYLRQISALKDENEFLRSLSNRLQTELKEYQIRFPQILVENQDHSNIDNKQTPNGDVSSLQNSDLAPWLSSSKYMSPLLVSYDSKIKELNEQIKNYQENALQIKKESDALINRNNDLQNQLETKVVALYKKLKIKSSAHHINKEMQQDIDSMDNNEYQQRINILNQQNQILRETEVRWKKEKENYMKIITENSKNIKILQTELNHVTAAHHELDELSNNLKYENNELHEIHEDLRNNVVKKLTEKSAYLEDRLKIERSQHNECKRRVNEYENEYISLNENHNALSSKYDQVSSENEELIDRVDALSDELNENKNILSANKEKLESMISSLGSIENVLQVYKTKELDYLQNINELKNNSELFINIEKDKLVTQISGLKQEITRIRGENQNILDDAEKENEAALKQLTQQYTEKQQGLSKNIDDLMTRNVKLSEERRDFENKYNVIQNDMNNIKKMYFEKFETLQTTQNELECSIKELESEAQRYLDLSKRHENNLTQQTHLWQSEREIFNETIHKLNATDDKKNLILIENEKEILDLKQMTEKLTEKAVVNEARSSKHIAQLSGKLNKTDTEYMESIENYKKEFKNLENLYNESQLHTKEIINKHETLSTKWKEENRNSLKHLKQMIDELKKQNKSLIDRNLSLETQLQNIVNDRKHAVNENILCKKKLKQTQNTLCNLNQTVDNLKSLNTKYQNKEGLLLNENKNLRNQLNQSTISMQRLQRNHQFNLKINSNNIH